MLPMHNTVSVVADHVAYLVEVGANPSLQVLAEVCKRGSVAALVVSSLVGVTAVDAHGC